MNQAPLQSPRIRKRDPDQPKLLSNAGAHRTLPWRSKTKPPQGDDRSYRIKWDGYHLAVHIEPSGVRIITRSGHDWTHRFSAIAEAAAWLSSTTMILDGEPVVLDKEDRSVFGLLQRSLGASGRDKPSCHRASGQCRHRQDVGLKNGISSLGARFQLLSLPS